MTGTGFNLMPSSDIEFDPSAVQCVIRGITGLSVYKTLHPFTPPNNISVFRLDALALSVIATATWLAGWVAGWLSHSGIVSKPLNLSENFFDRLKAPSL